MRSSSNSESPPAASVKTAIIVMQKSQLGRPNTVSLQNIIGAICIENTSVHIVWILSIDLIISNHNQCLNVYAIPCTFPRRYYTSLGPSWHCKPSAQCPAFALPRGIGERSETTRKRSSSNQCVSSAHPRIRRIACIHTTVCATLHAIRRKGDFSYSIRWRTPFTPLLSLYPPYLWYYTLAQIEWSSPLIPSTVELDI
ncbi:hypothetical protein BDR07DRAFT_1397052 [Suillus spraguei]|nr:hypothetical protein BDR07DRAFT_1397052 [Suillus spraguei]